MQAAAAVTLRLDGTVKERGGDAVCKCFNAAATAAVGHSQQLSIGRGGHCNLL